MKILIDARMVLGHHGIGHYSHELIQGLNAKGHEVSIFSSSDKTLEIIGQSSVKKIIRCRLPFAHPMESIELVFKTPKSEFDLVHFSSFAVPALRSPIPMVVTIHDLIHMDHPTLGHALYYKYIVKRALNNSAKIITVSHWTKNELSKVLKISDDKIIVVKNGLEPMWFTPSSQQLERIPTFLCLSNLKPHKNVSTLLQVSKDLWRRGFNFNLQLSLGGQDLPSEWNHLKSKINLIKNATDNEILTLLQKSWGLISPSIFEGYDYPVAQALAQGKPVIISRGSAHNEFSGKKVTFYGDPQDAAGLTECIKNAIKFPPTPEFDHNVITQSKMVDETIKVYESAIHPSPMSN
jgi:glycosyltransferase involved in cell wall biosynthesis